MPSPASGSAKRTVRLLEAMERAGALPHVLSADPEGAAAAAALRERGWRVDLLCEPPPGLPRRVAQHAQRRPSPYLRSVAGFMGDQRADPPAFVQAEHAMSTYYLPDRAARPWALSTHNVDSAMWRDIARGMPPGLARLRLLSRAAETAAVERRAAPKADAVLCVSEADGEHFGALGARPVIVPNGVDDALLDAPPARAAGEGVLFFGQLSYAPNALGLRRFLAAGWPRLVARRPAAELRIAGEGAPPELVAAVAAAPRARLLGFVDDLPAELARCALVVVPLWHGAGTRLKVLEALASGRPVVSTPLGAAGVGFADGRHGLLASDPAALADAAAAVLADPALAARLAVCGRRLAERFRWSTVTAPAAQLYARWSSRLGATGR